MPVRLFTPHATDIPALAQICFDAFGTLQDRHGVERDFDTVETAGRVMGMFCSRPDIWGVAARDSDEIVGSNFLQVSDPVAAVGPITVKPGVQSRGVGRALMDAVLRESRRREITRVRLLQEAINTTSLSLYTKLGFRWREAVALMRLTPAPADDPCVRALTGADLDAVDRISRRQYHATRVNECRVMLGMQMPGFALERRGEVEGYSFPGFLGHGFAPSAEDLAGLITHAARHVPPPFRKVLVPLGQHELHGTLLARGATTIKLFNYMTVGEFRAPEGAWVCSIGC